MSSHVIIGPNKLAFDGGAFQRFVQVLNRVYCYIDIPASLDIPTDQVM